LILDVERVGYYTEAVWEGTRPHGECAEHGQEQTRTLQSRASGYEQSTGRVETLLAQELTRTLDHERALRTALQLSICTLLRRHPRKLESCSGCCDNHDLGHMQSYPHEDPKRLARSCRHVRRGKTAPRACKEVAGCGLQVDEARDSLQAELMHQHAESAATSSKLRAELQEQAKDVRMQSLHDKLTNQQDRAVKTFSARRRRCMLQAVFWAWQEHCGRRRCTNC
jgi:hypothetical protein